MSGIWETDEHKIYVFNKDFMLIGPPNALLFCSASLPRGSGRGEKEGQRIPVGKGHLAPPGLGARAPRAM